MNAKRGTAQDEPAHHDDRQGDHHQPGNWAEIVIADPLEVDVRVNDRRAVGQQVRRAAQRRVGAERDDKGRQPGKGHQRAVKQAQHHAEHQRGGNGQPGEFGNKRYHHRGYRRGAENRPHGEINPAGEDNEGHSRRQHDVDRRLTGNVEQVALGKEVRSNKAKYRHNQDKNWQNTDRLHQIAHQHFFGGGGFRHLLRMGWSCHGYTA